MNNEVTIDVEGLREDLITYFGTAMFNGNPMAMMELEEVKRASDFEVIRIARKNNVDLRNYIVTPNPYRR